MKFAEVYPLKRMPRRFRAFDYSVPDGLEARRGDFVSVPLRGFAVPGVVSRVKDLPPEGIATKPIARTLGASLSERELDAYEKMAADLAQSPSSLLRAVLPVPPKRERMADEGAVPAPTLRVRAEDAPDVAESARFVRDHPACFVRSPDLRHAAAVIATYRRACPGPVRIAAPNVRDARMLHAALGGSVVTGEETNNARFAAWQAFRGTKDGLLVGTRLVSMLEHADGSTLFVVRSGHENHRQADRNPRYDARRAALQWARSGGKAAFLDALPRADDLHAFAGAVRCPPGEAPRVIDMAARGAWVHPFVSPAALTAVQEATEAGERVLLAFNRKGMARAMVCRDCGWSVPLSGAEPPRWCDSCHSSDVEARGFGTRSIAKAFQGAFPGISVAVCEKGEAPQAAGIVVATTHYLENAFDPFAPEPFALVADLDADAALADRSWRAMERALLVSARWAAVARAARCPFLLQTMRPEPFVRAFHDPVAAMAEELETRRAYGLEPFVRWITVDGKPMPLSALSSLSTIPDSTIIDTNAFS